jgi:uncharacterized protein YggT (Ycf19 family)
MAIIDFILSFAGVLLWLGATLPSFELMGVSSPAGDSPRRRGTPRVKRWHFAAALATLLLFRALLYWQVGSAVDWAPSLRLSAISVSFRSDFPGQMILFSVLGFGATLFVFYLWLLLLSLVNGHSASEEPVQKLVRHCLGRVNGWPWPIRLGLPFVVAVVLWLALNPLLVRGNIIPRAYSSKQALEEAALLALGAYLSWKYLIGGLLAMRLLSSYIYLGRHPFWSFVGLTGRNLLAPLRWIPLRWGRVDFAPLVGVALVFLAAEMAQFGLTTLYQRLVL